jgi:hypothetical protein
MKPRTRAAVLAASLLALAVLLPAGLRAAANGGSIYSRYGIGDLRYTLSTRQLAMGGTGAAVRPTGSVNDLNPASLSGIPRVRFTAAALYEGFKSTDGTTSVYLAGATFNGLALAIPVDSARGIVFGAGLVPYSRVNYKVTGPVDQDGFEYTLSQSGEGGVSKAFAAATVEPFAGMSVAAQFDFYFGSNRYIMKQEFSASYTGTEFTRIEEFRGPGATIGLLFDGLGRALGLPEGRGMAVGVTVASTVHPNTSTERVYDYEAAPSNSPNDTVDGGQGKIAIPVSITGGLSYTARNFLAAADFRYQDWSGTTFETTPLVTLTQSYRVSAGVEFTRDAGPGVPVAHRFSYAFGAYYDAGYLDAGGVRISESGVTAGFSFPIYNETRLALAGGFAMRGSTDGLLQEDKIFRISASMDITEFWFQRPEEE